MTGPQPLSQPDSTNRNNPSLEGHNNRKMVSNDNKTVGGKSQQRPGKMSLPFSPDLPVTKNEQVARLVGKKVLTQCYLNSLAMSVLLDTGAQVSMIDREWKNKYLPDSDIRPLAEIIEDEEELAVYAVNGDPLPFDVWVAITGNLPGNEDPNLSISVPFLVSKVNRVAPPPNDNK